MENVARPLLLLPPLLSLSKIAMEKVSPAATHGEVCVLVSTEESCYRDENREKRGEAADKICL